eukprot:Hpha_TRINITY_DN15053_c0_g2::TRINITY_DN15053_c0_g2_i1::g.125274::m.125274
MSAANRHPTSSRRGSQSPDAYMASQTSGRSPGRVRMYKQPISPSRNRSAIGSRSGSPKSAAPPPKKPPSVKDPPYSIHGSYVAVGSPDARRYAPSAGGTEKSPSRSPSRVLSKTPRDNYPLQPVPSSLRRTAQRVWVGATVERNPAHWDRGNEDGGAGQRGVITEVLKTQDGWQRVRVAWDRGVEAAPYRWGENGAYDLSIVTPSSSAPAKEAEPRVFFRVRIDAPRAPRRLLYKMRRRTCLRQLWEEVVGQLPSGENPQNWELFWMREDGDQVRVPMDATPSSLGMPAGEDSALQFSVQRRAVQSGSPPRGASPNSDRLRVLEEENRRLRAQISAWQSTPAPPSQRDPSPVSYSLPDDGQSMGRMQGISAPPSQVRPPGSSLRTGSPVPGRGSPIPGFRGVSPKRPPPGSPRSITPFSALHQQSSQRSQLQMPPSAEAMSHDVHARAVQIFRLYSLEPSRADESERCAAFLARSGLRELPVETVRQLITRMVGGQRSQGLISGEFVAVLQHVGRVVYPFDVNPLQRILSIIGG